LFDCIIFVNALYCSTGCIGATTFYFLYFISFYYGIDRWSNANILID